MSYTRPSSSFPWHTFWTDCEKCDNCLAVMGGEDRSALLTEHQVRDMLSTGNLSLWPGLARDQREEALAVLRSFIADVDSDISE